MARWVDMDGNPAPESLRPILDEAERILDAAEDDPDPRGAPLSVDEAIALLRAARRAS